MTEDTKPKKERKPWVRDSRGEYLLAFIFLCLFEQFMYHQWKVYDQYKARE
jgi:hypothetical protein